MANLVAWPGPTAPPRAVLGTCATFAYKRPITETLQGNFRKFREISGPTLKVRGVTCLKNSVLTFGLTLGLTFGLTLGLTFGLTFGLTVGLTVHLTVGLTVHLTVGLMFT